MEPNQVKPRDSDEVDLTQFFRWIGRGFSRLGNSFLFGLSTIRNLFYSNRLFFFGIISLGLLLGLTYYKLLTKKYYKTSMVLSCDYLNTQILDNTIEKLNLLCQEPAREGLAELLKIDTAIAKNIQGFEFKPFVSEDDVVEMEVLKTQLNNVAPDKREIVDKVMLKLEIENKNAYDITVQVYNPDIVKPLEKALINYFRSNEYVKRRIKINYDNLVNRRTKLLSESRKLDSLKRILYDNYQVAGRASKGSNNVYLGDEKFANPLDVFKEDLQINKEILTLEHDIYIQADFEVVEGFTTFKQPENASLFKILFIAFWVSFFMGYIIIGMWRFDRLLANYPNRS